MGKYIFNLCDMSGKKSGELEANRSIIQLNYCIWKEGLCPLSYNGLIVGEDV